MADVSAGLQENHDIKATEVDETGVAVEVKPSMSSHTNETGDNSQNASPPSSTLKHPQDTTPKKMEKTEKEKENKERGRPSSGSPSLTKGSPGKMIANNDSRHEREEKVRITRERQEEERRRKIEEFRESNQRAADFRRKQEDERQRKILEARQKEQDRRMTVEERRKKLFQEENERKQAILRKTAERESKLNQHRSGSRQHAIFGFAATTAPIARRPKSSHSDNTLSSSEWSPMRRPRPHSVGGRLPSYASPTFSSQAHHGRSADKKADGNQLVCHRFRSVSPVGKLRSKSADPSTARRSRADLRRTFERLSAPKVPSAKDTSSPTKTAPVKDKTPVRSSARSLSSQRHGSARPSPVGSAANTAAAKVKSTPPKMQPAVARTVTPALKPSIPSISRNSKPTPKGPVKAVHIKVTSTQEKKPTKKAPPPKEASPVKEKKPAEDTTAKSEDKTKQISEDDYKAKLAEKRRQAREKAEREAEEAKQREEQRIREEEERRRKEEEEQRRLEEEELRLAEEARLAEAERLKKAIEAEEKRKKEEEERLEAEKKAKEVAEKLAQEEAERKEAERLVRMKREEEERIARKKKLEMIMKRVKVDDTSPKSETATNSVSMEEKVGGDDAPAPVAVAVSDEGAPKFKSALLQQMLGKKGRLGRSTEKLSDSSKSSSEEKEDDSQKKTVELEDIVPQMTTSQELAQKAEADQQPEAKDEQQHQVKEQQPEVKKQPEVKEQQPGVKEQQPEVKEEQQPEVKEEQQPEVKEEQQPEVKEEQQPEIEQQAEVEQPVLEPDQQSNLNGQDEAEYSEEKPVIQMNDIVMEDASEPREALDDISTDAGSAQSVESLKQEASMADSKDSCSELGNGDLIGNTDAVESGSVCVSGTTSSNSVHVSDQDSKESLRERLEQDKDIDTAEVDSGAKSVLMDGVDSEAVQRTETVVSSAVCADPPDLLGGLDTAVVSEGHHDLNGFTKCDNSEDMLQLDSKLDMRPNGSSADHFEQVIDLSRIEGDKQLINLGLDMMTDGQTVSPSAPLIAFEENANKGLPDMMS